MDKVSVSDFNINFTSNNNSLENNKYLFKLQYLCIYIPFRVNKTDTTVKLLLLPSLKLFFFQYNHIQQNFGK